MTSISSGTSVAAMRSPGDRMKQQLASAVSSGSVKAADATALSSALDEIDGAMKASAPSAPSGDGKPVGGKEKIDGLIDQEVSDGKLSDDQATELKKLFADAAPQMGGAQAAGGPPPMPAGTNDDDAGGLIASLTATSSGAASPSAGGTGGSDPVTALIDFLKTLQTRNADKTVYGADGGSTAASLQSLLVDGLA